jgi:hypothetical protein
VCVRARVLLQLCVRARVRVCVKNFPPGFRAPHRRAISPRQMMMISRVRTVEVPASASMAGASRVARDGFYAKIVSLEGMPAQHSDTFDQILELDVASVCGRA